MKQIIQSTKHYVQIPIASVVLGAIAPVKFAHAKEDVTVGNPEEFAQGGIVKAFYVELWIVAEGNQVGSFTVTIEKVPAGANLMTKAQSADLWSYPNKKNVLYTSQGLIGDQNTNPVPVIRQWFAVPKGKQRFGLEDRLVLSVAANAENIQFCGNTIYKVYT